MRKKQTLRDKKKKGRVSTVQVGAEADAVRDWKEGGDGEGEDFEDQEGKGVQVGAEAGEVRDWGDGGHKEMWCEMLGSDGFFKEGR